MSSANKVTNLFLSFSLKVVPGKGAKRRRPSVEESSDSEAEKVEKGPPGLSENPKKSKKSSPDAKKKSSRNPAEDRKSSPRVAENGLWAGGGSGSQPDNAALINLPNWRQQQNSPVSGWSLGSCFKL